MPSPTRRTVLALGVLTGTLLASGCTDDHRDPDRADRPDPDLPLRARAVAATDTLLAGYDAVATGADAAATAVLRRQRAETAAHRAALAEGLPAASPSASVPASPSASPSTVAPSTASPSPSPSASGAVATVAALAAAERRTAGARLADLEAASPALAELLAAVSASGALHAAALGDTGPVTPPTTASPSASVSASASVSPSASVTAPASPSPSPGSATARPASGSASGGSAAASAAAPTAAVVALQAALGAEHAAVYGYGVVGARLTGPQRDDARTAYTAHQARRDGLERRITGTGASPAAAAAGYRLPFAVTDAAAAGRLAAHIETRLTAVYADAVGATTGEARQAAAAALRESALRAAHWGAVLPALPGLPDPAADTTPSADATPGTGADTSAGASPRS
ncbi:hypothetical protein KNE206_71020 [Kitasatospora sp. NE20-6]|uniref:ferritin-like domain-containing protein n=1 Tax=Kitasatospora sp. NE20-6 TaxID=2859066 RepID=UPI0034DC5424